MGVYSNNPTFTYISATGVSVTWGEEVYMVQSFNTNKKYVFWNANNPNQLQASNTMPNRSSVQYLVLINDNGIATEVPSTSEDFSISYDGNNSQAIKDRIFGLYEIDEDNKKRFAFIESDIEGLKQVVGEGGVGGDGYDHSTIWEKISEIEQTAGEIGLSVKEINKQFSDNKEVQELRENLNKSVIDFNSSLGIFKSEMYSYCKDNKISSEEKIEIDAHLEVMDYKKSEVLKHVETVITMMREGGQTTQVNGLNSAKTKLINSVSNLRSYITTAISDNTIVPSEITIIADMFAKCNLAINQMSKVCDDCIYLGAGGKISEELARIGIKSDEIRIGVSHTEESIKNNLGIEKSLLQGNVTDLKNAINKLTSTWNDIAKDSSATQEEIEIVNNRLAEVELEKKDIDDKCVELNENEHLSEPEKIKLNSKNDEMSSKFAELKAKVNSVVQDGIVTDTESNQLKTLINVLLVSLSELHSIAVECIDNIQKNLTSAEIQEAKDSLKSEIDDVSNSVVDLDDYMNTIFKDNIISHSERLVLEEKIKEIEKEKIDIDAKYEDLYNNPDLLGGQYSNFVKIHFIDTGVAGDCIFIQCDNGQNIIIDSNEWSANEKVVAYLKSIGVDKISHIICTHHHSDHNGAFPAIINNFNVVDCIAYHKTPDWSKMPSIETEWKTKQCHDSFVSACTDKGVSLVTPTEKQRIQIDSETYLEFYNTNNNDYNNYNNLSLVVLLVHKNLKYLFLGDISVQAQDRIYPSLPSGVEIVKAQHHDYDYEFSESFMDKIKAQGYVITNPKKHADGRARAVSGFAQYNEVPYYALYENKTIVLTSDGGRYSLNPGLKTLYKNSWWNRGGKGNWYWFKENGLYARNENITINGKVYNFDGKGLCTNP